MTKSEAREVIKKSTKCKAENCPPEPCHECDYFVSDEEWNEVFEKALEALESSDWIPCEEKMPETHQSDFGGVFSGIIRSCKVLVTSESGDVFVCRAVETRYSGLCWIDANECQRDDIIAWMPMPDPYKEG